MSASAQNRLTERIREFIPSGYGHVVLNFGEMPANPRIGIVIPTFSRMEYVQQTLTSLRNSLLPDGCVLVIIDETMASKEPRCGEFSYFENIDFEGGDIQQIKSRLDQIQREADENPSCVAFNDAGWLKHSLANPRIIRNSRFGTYIRKSYLKENPAFHQQILLLEKSCSVMVQAETVKVIEAFDMDIPIIKIFKSHHQNMFDSLKVGFDLCMHLFQVNYLVNLDSDTLQAPEWLVTLLQTHEVLQADRVPHPVVLSGFNADKKENLQVRDTYVIKGDLGGINLFFDVQTYTQTVRHTLKNIGWDIELSNTVRGQQGTLAAVRQSVIQHIGKEGMWSSHDNHDYSSTFRQHRI